MSASWVGPAIEFGKLLLQIGIRIVSAAKRGDLEKVEELRKQANEMISADLETLRKNDERMGR